MIATKGVVVRCRWRPEDLQLLNHPLWTTSQHPLAAWPRPAIPTDICWPVAHALPGYPRWLPCSGSEGRQLISSCCWFARVGEVRREPTPWSAAPRPSARLSVLNEIISGVAGRMKRAGAACPAAKPPMKRGGRLRHRPTNLWLKLYSYLNRKISSHREFLLVFLFPEHYDEANLRVGLVEHQVLGHSYFPAAARRRATA